MESNSNDNYVLVLEDRTEVKNEKEAGKLSVVSGIDDKGNLKTTEAIAANQAAFLKFNNKYDMTCQSRHTSTYNISNNRL